MPTPTFQMRFDLDNAEFDGAPLDRAAGISRLLRETADKVDMGDESGDLFDINGNKVGAWGFDQIDPDSSDD